MYNPLDLHEQIYEKFHLWPNDGLGTRPDDDRDAAIRRRLAVRDSLIAQGIITPGVDGGRAARGVSDVRG